MTIDINPPATRADLRTLEREYKRWYNKGWRYSASPSANLDCAAARPRLTRGTTGISTTPPDARSGTWPSAAAAPSIRGGPDAQQADETQDRLGPRLRRRGRREIKVLRDAQRAAFGRATGEDRRQLSLAVSIIEADRRFQVVSIKDGRNPGNQRQSTRPTSAWTAPSLTYAPTPAASPMVRQLLALPRSDQHRDRRAGRET